MATVTIEQLNRITIFHITGELTFDEILETIIHAYPAVTYHILWDLTNGSVDPTTTTDQFQTIPLIAKKFLPNRIGGKTAYVSSIGNNFGLLRMYSSYAGLAMPTEYRVFKAIEEAFIWLHEPESN